MDNIEQKAKELLQKFTDELFDDGHDISKPMIKKCAIICVDEIIASHKNKSPDYEKETYWHPIDYWQQVKEKIQSL